MTQGTAPGTNSDMWKINPGKNLTDKNITNKDAIPILVTLVEEEIRFYEGVPLVPVLKLNSFINESDKYAQGNSFWNDEDTLLLPDDLPTQSSGFSKSIWMRNRRNTIGKIILRRYSWGDVFMISLKGSRWSFRIMLYGLPGNCGNAELPDCMVFTSVYPGYVCGAGAAIQYPGG
jgi:hypothetical protein